MKDMSSHLIKCVIDESIAGRLGIVTGDLLFELNGSESFDVLNYMSAMADDYIELTIKSQDNDVVIYEIEKMPDEDIGIVFENWLMSKQHDCVNKCIFCFVDQLPDGVRSTMCEKDDDWRLSLLMGNYITLTNMKDKDFDRIINEGYSPLYISVHSTDPNIRKYLLKSRWAGDIKKRLDSLSEGSISFHSQIVICPGVNDGDDLENTIKELSSYGEFLMSIALVPLGMTAYRDDLPNLSAFSAQDAIDAIAISDKWQKHFLQREGIRKIYAADEMYVKAGVDIPDFEEYEDFPQYENGIGIAAKLINEIENSLSKYNDIEFISSKKLKISLLTGKSAEKVLNKAADMITSVIPVEIEVVSIVNTFFGESVTVAGLVTGRDIVETMKQIDIGDIVFIPDVMLKSDIDIFLDDMTLEDVKKQTDVKIIMLPIDGGILVDSIAEMVK